MRPSSRAVIYGALAVASAAVSNALSEEEQVKITNSTEECTVYWYAGWTDVKDQFPPIWKTADIVEGDETAHALFNEINATLPTYIKPKGTTSGDFSAVRPTYDHSDPDCWWTYSTCKKPKYEGLGEDYAELPEPETWGLAFDDGPNCTHNKFYDFMAQEKLKATMFYIGSNVADWPLQAIRGYNDGHQLCVHTWSHQYMTSHTNSQAFAELYYTTEVIRVITGVTPTCWRPPFGDIDDRIRMIAAGLGLRTVMWEFDTNDWKIGSSSNVSEADVRKNYENVFARAANGTFKEHGTIVLTHEIHSQSMDLFMEQYPKIKANFKNIAPLYATWNETEIYVESNGTKGETFADWVNSHGGSIADTATTNTHTHPNPTLTGTAGPLATVDNPAVTSVLQAAAVTAGQDGAGSGASAVFPRALVGAVTAAGLGALLAF